MRIGKGFFGTKKNDQEGFAALIVAVVLVMVLSLMTVGFATLMRHEQTASFNRQLSSEAQYAAESGINDAVEALQKGTVTDSINTCDTTWAPSSPFGSNKLSSTVYYSCLLVDMAPPTLEYQSIGYDGEVLRLTGVDSSGNPVPIKTLRISWQDAQGGTQFADSSFKFPTASAWTSNTGVLRASVVGLANLDRNTLINNAYQAFLYPNGVNNPGSLGSSSYAAQAGSWQNKGTIVPGDCNAANNGGSQPLACSVDITNINSASLLVTLQSIYSESRVSIRGFDSSDNPVDLKGPQALIDSTGDADDVLRREQVRVPIDKNPYPNNVIEAAGNICKLFSVAPGMTPIDSCHNPADVTYTVGIGSQGPGRGPGGGDHGGPGKGINWTRFFVNNSSAPGLSCTWSYAPEPPGSGGATMSTSHCNPGDSFTYGFPQGDPSQCHGYNVTLTMVFPGGKTQATTKYIEVPRVTSGGTACQG